MSVSKEQEWGYRETDFFFLSFTEVHTFSHKFRSRLHSMSFPFYKTKAGKVTEQVGLHGIPLSRFSSLCPAGTALPSAIVWNQHLVTLPPALACFMELGDQPLAAALDTQFVRYKELSPSRPEILIQWVRAPKSGFYQLSWWWFWCRRSRNYIWRTLVWEPRLPPGGKKHMLF